MKVSVITVVKDHASGLKTTYESLIGQSFEDWEMVIVVGNSRDETMDTALKYPIFDPRIKVLVQRGTGIYDAMNQGLQSATGEFTWFMNAGDRFATSSTLVHALEKAIQDKAGLIIGGYEIDNGADNQIFSFPEGNVTTLDFAFTRRGGCHQAMIFRTAAIREVGGFDTAYSLASDFDLVLKVMKTWSVKRVSEVYASIEPGGRADQGISLVHKQKHQIRRDLLGGPFIFTASLLWTSLARLKISLRRALKG